MAHTIRELLDWGQQQLKSASIVNPRVAAEIIIRHLLKLRRVDLYVKDSDPVPEPIVDEYRSLIARKLNREPLQYIVGETEWFGLTIKCTPSALIPRPETEVIVERALDAIVDVRDPLAADIGTGTGCIAIALAVSRPDVRIIATDISPTALELARENVKGHNLENRVVLRTGNLLEPLERGELFDLIVSNPPYIPEPDLAGLMPEVREYEPRTALVAGPDGLSVIRRLIEEAPGYLKPRGLLIFEIGENQVAEIRRIVQDSARFDILETIVDYNGKGRGVVLRKR